MLNKVLYYNNNNYYYYYYGNAFFSVILFRVRRSSVTGPHHLPPLPDPFPARVVGRSHDRAECYVV